MLTDRMKRITTTVALACLVCGCSNSKQIDSAKVDYGVRQEGDPVPAKSLINGGDLLVFVSADTIRSTSSIPLGENEPYEIPENGKPSPNCILKKSPWNIFDFVIPISSSSYEENYGAYIETQNGVFYVGSNSIDHKGQKYFWVDKNYNTGYVSRSITDMLIEECVSTGNKNIWSKYYLK